MNAYWTRSSNWINLSKLFYLEFVYFSGSLCAKWWQLFLRQQMMKAPWSQNWCIGMRGKEEILRISISANDWTSERAIIVSSVWCYICGCESYRFTDVTLYTTGLLALWRMPAKFWTSSTVSRCNRSIMSILTAKESLSSPGRIW